MISPGKMKVAIKEKIYLLQENQLGSIFTTRLQIAANGHITKPFNDYFPPFPNFHILDGSKYTRSQRNNKTQVSPFYAYYRQPPYYNTYIVNSQSDRQLQNLLKCSSWPSFSKTNHNPF